ncbi:MAG TPA: DUF5615 family PIN-like protein [Tepidisphaeraceae bacterium]|jgi:hypothetical protein
MIVLDENLRRDQFEHLRRWGFAVRQIGYELGWEGMDDENIIELLHRLKDPTFFTEDLDFWRKDWLHPTYCIVFLVVSSKQTATFCRRLLRHPRFSSNHKRLGHLIKMTRDGMTIWQRYAKQEEFLPWSA